MCEGEVNYKIVPFEPKYRDDMIFMILEAKNAMGRVPGLNEDLLDIRKNHLEKGGMYWIAVDKHDRVIGSVGYNSVDNSDEVWLRRLFVKYSLKRRGIGSALLETAEAYLRRQGKSAVLVHLGGEDWIESLNFYPKHGYKEVGPFVMCKQL